MYRVGVLLLDGFALMSYASLVEPFRAANFLDNEKLYQIVNLTEINIREKKLFLANGKVIAESQLVI